MKKIVICSLVILFNFSALAQNKQPGMRWGGGVDYDKFHWGFNLSYVGSSLKVFKEANWNESGLPQNTLTDKINSIKTPFSSGFGFGLLTGVRIHENANLYFSPTVLFTDKEVQYSYGTSNNTEILTKELKASLLELPLSIKLKSDRRKNYGIYLLAGGKYSHNVVSKKILDDSQLPAEQKQLKLIPGFLSFEAGLGVDIYFEYFKMSPEIKWSQSVGNVLDKSSVNKNDFNTPIDKMLLRSVQFSLIFQ